MLSEEDEEIDGDVIGVDSDTNLDMGF